MQHPSQLSLSLSLFPSPSLRYFPFSHFYPLFLPGRDPSPEPGVELIVH